MRTLIRNKSIPCKLEEGDMELIARETEGWCGADLENLLNESGYRSIRKQEQQISIETLK